MPPPAEGFVTRFLVGPALRAQPDGRLVTLVRDGYDTAFEEIVRRYGGALRRHTAGIVGGRAEDVTQDAFSKALLALRRDGAEIDLRALPDSQRAAIVMRELEGLGHDEIAAAAAAPDPRKRRRSGSRSRRRRRGSWSRPQGSSGDGPRCGHAEAADRNPAIGIDAEAAGPAHRAAIAGGSQESHRAGHERGNGSRGPGSDEQGRRRSGAETSREGSSDNSHGGGTPGPDDGSGSNSGPDSSGGDDPSALETESSRDAGDGDGFSSQTQPPTEED